MSQPIQITSWAELQSISANLSGNYVLANNLSKDTPGYAEFAGPTANGGAGWLPIGNNTTRFIGTFNGQGFSISDLFINRPTTNWVGLFGNATNIISNLRLFNINITGHEFVGGLSGERTVSIGGVSSDNIEVIGQVRGTANVGGMFGLFNLTSSSGVMRNCRSDVSVSASGSNAGGLLGNIGSLHGRIENCHAKSTITPLASIQWIGGFAGGISGVASSIIRNCSANTTILGIGSVTNAFRGGFAGRIMSDGLVEKCFAVGSIEAPGISMVGGFIGASSMAVSRITDCYSNVNVLSGANQIGGFVGDFSMGHLSFCYANGIVNGTGANLGGFSGQGVGTSWRDCFWDTEISGRTTSTIGVGRTTAQMRDTTTYPKSVPPTHSGVVNSAWEWIFGTFRIRLTWVSGNNFAGLSAGQTVRIFVGGAWVSGTIHTFESNTSLVLSPEFTSSHVGTNVSYGANFFVGWDMIPMQNHNGQEATATWFINNNVDTPRLWYQWTAPPQATITRIPTSLNFSAIHGGSNPANQPFTISNTGQAGSTLNFTVSDDAGWLSLNPLTGALGQNASQEITASVNISGLAVGTHTATITITDTNASNSPQTIGVALVITAPTPTISLSTPSLSFTASEGGSNPANQTFDITNTGMVGSTLNWSASDNAGWLSFTPMSGALGQGTSREIVVSADISGLSVGTHNATITVTGNATNSPQAVTVALTITPQPPAITTVSATAIKKTTATLNGDLTSLGSFTSVNVLFRYREKGTTNWTATEAKERTTTGTFNQGITGLTQSTTYEFRAVVQYDSQEVLGAILEFATQTAPAITTTPADSIKTTSATLNGSLDGLGSFSSVDCFFECREKGAIDWIETIPRETRTSIGTFNIGISGLEHSTTYEFRAVASYNGHTLAGSVLEFTTLTPPAVATSPATNIAITTADLQGDLTSLGSYLSVGCLFRYRKKGDTEWIPTEAEARTTTGVFEGSITGLFAETTYQFKAVATYNGKEVVGDIVEFATLPAPKVPSIMLFPTSLSFTASEGGGNPADQTFDITNTGDIGSVLDFEVISDVAWLTLSPTSGSLEVDETAKITVAIDILVLTEGIYTGEITVTIIDETNP